MSVNTAGGTYPHISITHGHMNILNDCINLTSTSAVFIDNNLLWQGANTASAGVSIRLTDCADVIISHNNMRGGRVLVDYYGILLSGTTSNVQIVDNLAIDCIYLAWAQGGTDKIFARNNHTKRENTNPYFASWGALYANTSAGRVVIDAERFSGKSASNVTAASGTLVDVDMGTVDLGQKFTVTAKVLYTKGGTAGLTSTEILRGAGTAAVVFVHDSSTLDLEIEQDAGDANTHTVSGTMVVTTTGTLTLRCRFTSAGSGATILAGAAQLSAIQIGQSGRVL